MQDICVHVTDNEVMAIGRNQAYVNIGLEWWRVLKKSDPSGDISETFAGLENLYACKWRYLQSWKCSCSVTTIVHITTPNYSF